MNKVCKEHEWVQPIENQRLICMICGEQRLPIDFHIEENLEVINKQEWEDIFRQYKKWVCRNNFNLLPVWLEDNYLAPEKK